MKKFLFSIIALCSLFACSSEIDDIKKEIEELEKDGQALQRQKDSLENENNKQEKENKETQEQIDSTISNILWKSNEVMLSYVEFLQGDNPYQLIQDVKCEMVGDSLVCWVPNIMPNKVLIPRFSYIGKSLTIDGKEAESGVTAFDFGKPLKLKLSSELRSKEFLIYVYSYTGIPLLWLKTNNREDVSVSEKVYQAQLKLVENVGTRAAGDVTEANVKLMAVGPISWVRSTSDNSSQMGKNEYRITFSSSFSLLDEPSSNKWELLSNANDITLLHTQAGFHMGKISNLHYTPRFHFVDLMLNERYFGTYMLGDAIDYSTDRVDVGLDGFIVKIDASTSYANFRTDHIEQPVNIVYPTVSSSEENYRIISDYIKAADAALFSSNFTDTTEGWQKYLDMESFVDWYLINEIAKNENGAFYADCYMNKTREGKLRMGPLWKMEKSFGYGESSTEGFVIKNTKWYKRLFEDPAFVTKVKDRFTYFYNHRKDIIQEIDEDAYYIRYAVLENSKKWQFFDNNSSVGVGVLYNKEVSSMKSWLDKRMEWLNSEISKM